MTQQQTITWATQRILGAQTEPKIGVPKRLLFHTMVGSLVGTDSMFRQGGFDGTESTFGVGGPWGIDGERGLDGELWQWQLMGYQADANWDANADSDSVETADGGNPNNPWSSKQLLTLIQLTVDWCRINNRPCVLVGDPSAEGLGYHEQFIQWNHSHHVCPGVIREGQLRTIVIPKARALLTGKPVPHAPKPKPGPASHPTNRLRVDGIMGAATIGAMQHVLVAHGLNTGGVDGLMGPRTRIALQHYLGVPADGIIGSNTVKALQARLVRIGALARTYRTRSGRTMSSIDGQWGKGTTKALQSALNAGKF
jgi:hypothetical protein